jgi:hypothetical protein
MRMQYLEKIESKVDCACTTFLKLNEFKQLIAQKKKLDPLSVLRVIRSRSIIHSLKEEL